MKAPFNHRSLLEGLPQKIFLKTPDSTYILCNSRYAAAFDLAPDAIEGRTDFDLFPRKVAEKLRRDDARVLAAGTADETEERTMIGGREVWLRITRSPLRDADGAIAGLLGSCRDVSRRKREEQRTARLAEILEVTPDFVAMIDRERRLTWINPAGLELLGYPPEGPAEGLDPDALHPDPARRRVFDEALRTAAERGRWSGETELVARDGRPIPLWQVVVAHKNEDGNVLDYSLLARDLTGRLEDQERIRRLNRELEERVRQRAADLQSTVTALEAEGTERLQAETALGEERRRLQTLMDNLPGMAFRCRNDDDWTMERVSHGSLELTGYAPGDLVGNRVASYAELIHPDDRRRIWEEVQAAAAEHVPFVLEYRIRTAGGAERRVREQGRAVRSADGGIEALEGFVMDVTEAREAQAAVRRSEERFRKSFRSGLIGMAVTSPEKNWLEVNDRLCDILGYSPAELTAMRWPELTHPEDLAADLARFDRLLDGKADDYTLEKRFIRKDGRHVHTFIAVNTLRGTDGSPDFFICMVQDISERKAAEEKLARTMAELRRSNQELGQFAYVASHDLQEPLRMVTSYVQLLGRRYRGQLDADADDFIDFAVEGATRMQTLINDLLAFSRAGREDGPFTDVDCEQLLDRTIRALHGSIEAAGASITRDPLPRVTGHPVQLGQVFQNLLGNAIKFRGADPPRIHIGARRKSTQWEISVSDNGIGIDPQDFGRLFTLFQRLNSRKKYPGTGIGLALSKKIIEQHGGRIRLESEPGRGTTFYFTLSGAD